jgi:XapX domain-containing protein
MPTYIVALAAGIVVGVFCECLGVRSPAPPVVALVGLFGILIGEQIIPVSKHLLAGHSLPTAWMPRIPICTCSECCRAITATPTKIRPRQPRKGHDRST